YQNPVVSGFAADPSVVNVDGVFYLVTSSFFLFLGIPIYVSSDLRNWTLIGHAINRREQLSLTRAATGVFLLDTGHTMIAHGGLFAPTIRHHNNTFYIVCTNAVSTTDSLRLDNFVISTKDSFNRVWSDPVSIVFNGLDPSLFFDDDERVYFQGACFLGDRLKQPPTKIVQFEIDLETGKALSEEREIWGGHARYDTEGSHIYKIGKRYYLLAAEGETFEHHMVTMARSKDIWGPYETADGCSPILTAHEKNEYIQNVGHGEFFQDAAGQWWAVVLGVRDEETCQPLSRETFLTTVEWSENDWPKVMQPKAKFTGPIAQIGVSDPIRCTAPPGIEDVYNRTPDFSKYKLPKTWEGSFSLTPSVSNLSEPYGTSTFIGKRQRSLSAIAGATLDLEASTTEERRGVKAGLSVYKDSLRHITLTYDFGNAEVTCNIHNGATGVDIVLPTRIPIRREATKLRLKIEASTRSYTFYTMTGLLSDNDWVEVGSCATKDLACRKMSGPIFGIFAHSVDKTDGLEVAFRDFIVQNH
ncbi:glycosyl hydrolase, partial [Mariannaea sp. PMI_226]